VAAAALVALAIRAGQAGGRREAALLLWLVAGQMALGIITVLSGVAIWIAVAHQAIGALLVLATVAALHRIGARA
jgi:cytochrome c oxidase assembly protein subunit 15